jgi:hypothetical protein
MTYIPQSSTRAHLSRAGETDESRIQFDFSNCCTSYIGPMAMCELYVRPGKTLYVARVMTDHRVREICHCEDPAANHLHVLSHSVRMWHGDTCQWLLTTAPLCRKNAHKGQHLLPVSQRQWK